MKKPKPKSESNEIPKQAREMGGFISLVIDEATKGLHNTFINSGLRCFRKGCHGEISTLLPDVFSDIEWKCSKCVNGGTISDWHNSGMNNFR
ncbi:MAG: hypothetical protein NTW49_12140 [Bacteroidia bacterium]|nr:hypothetical protein [Bacteroidia bacterium]